MAGGICQGQAACPWVNPAELAVYYTMFGYTFDHAGVTFKDTDFGPKIATIVAAITAADPRATSPT